MTDSIERRPIAGTRLTTSVLGISLSRGPRTSPEPDRAAVAGLRRALADGVTTFDLTSVPSVPRAAQLIVSAVPEPDDRLVFWLRPVLPSSLLPLRAAPASAPWASSGSASVSREEFVASIRALRGRGSVLIDWDPEEDSAPEARSTAVWLDELESEGLVAGRSRHLRPRRLSEIPRNSIPSEFPVSTEISLLDPLTAQSLDVLFGGRSPCVLVRDPFAGGLLDGSRTSSGLTDRDLPARPIDLRTLHAEFDPVLRLAPLTRDGRRTLAQAAIQYILRWSWTAAVMVPVASTGRWDEIRSALFRPPPSERVLASLGLIPRREEGAEPAPSS